MGHTFLVFVMALFKKKGKDGRKGVDRYGDLVDLLCQPDLGFVTAICNACHPSKQAAILDSVVYVMERQEKTIAIIKHGITQTVNETQDGGTLFRENTTVTKLMTAYAKTIGKNYLVNTLKRLVTLLFSSTEGFEVNPAKADPGRRPGGEPQQPDGLVRAVCGADCPD